MTLTWERVSDLLVNPIMVKELRAGTRGARFFTTHLIILLLFAGSLLLVFGAFMAESFEVPDPSLIGRRVFLVSQILQLVAVFLIVPAFAATSITTERERQTLDILMSTALTPWQIAWGKFAASMTQVMMIFVSLVPLVALTFLFGGVTFGQVISNYVFLFVMAACLSVWALSVSASVKSTQRAVISIYAGTILLGLLFYAAIAAMANARILENYLVAYGFMDANEPGMGGTVFDTFQSYLYVYLGPLGLAAAAFTFFYLHSVTRLQPVFADRSTPHRMYFAALLLFLLVMAWASMAHDFSAAGAEERSYFMAVLGSLLLILLSASALFACEDAVPARHLRARYEALPPHRRWLRLLGTGSESGWWYCMLVSFLFVGLAIIGFQSYTKGFDSGTWARAFPTVPLLIAFGSILPWIYFIASVGRLLSTLMPSQRVGIRLLLFGMVLALSLAPMAHWAIVTAMAPRHHRVLQDVATGPWTLALSPVATIWSGAMLTHGPYDVPLMVQFGSVLRVPLHILSLIVFMIGGLVAHSWGTRRMKLLREKA